MEVSYHYKARDKFGKSQEGQMVAGSDDEVATKLRENDLTPFSIEAVEQKAGSGFMDRFRRLKASDINAFTRELYTLNKAGLTILASLEVIAEQDRDSMLKKVVEGMIQSIRGGESISDSLGHYPKIFDPLFVNMIRAGEVSGRLDQILERLIFLRESDEKLRMRVKSALRYPALVMGALVIAFLVISNLIIPRFAQLFAKSGVELPLPTRILLGIHDAFAHYGLLLFGLMIVAGFFLVKFLKTPVGKLLKDRLFLRVPIFGPLILKAEMSRFARIVAILVQSGVPALQALEISEGSADNKVVAGAINKLRVSVTEGSSMAQPMKDSGIFPPSVVRMVRVGEETGKIDELLLRVSDYYDMQVDYTVGNLMVLIEPILIVVMGSMVFVLALGMFLPMWNMITLFRK